MESGPLTKVSIGTRDYGASKDNMLVGEITEALVEHAATPLILILLLLIRMPQFWKWKQRHLLGIVSEIQLTSLYLWGVAF